MSQNFTFIQLFFKMGFSSCGYNEMKQSISFHEVAWKCKFLGVLKLPLKTNNKDQNLRNKILKIFNFQRDKFWYKYLSKIWWKLQMKKFNWYFM